MTLERLMELPTEEIETRDIAEMNLLCAQGLPGGEQIDFPKSLALLDDWADTVRHSISLNSPRFRANPAEYRNSENLFKMVMLVLTLQQDLKVHYDPSKMGSAIFSGDPAAIQRDLADERYFQDSQSVFLHGILGPDRRGTCSSLPVLYIAIGRRLGFPLKLVTAKAHLFVRWDDGGERFNIEGTGDGVDSPPDDHYRNGPLPVSQEEVDKGLYLQSLTASGELAVFLENRALCLKANQHYDAALVALAQANRLRPRHSNTEIGLARLVDLVTDSLPSGENQPLSKQSGLDPEAQREAVIKDHLERERLRLKVMTGTPPMPGAFSNQPALPSGIQTFNMPLYPQGAGPVPPRPAGLPSTPR